MQFYEIKKSFLFLFVSFLQFSNSFLNFIPFFLITLRLKEKK